MHSRRRLRLTQTPKRSQPTRTPSFVFLESRPVASSESVIESCESESCEMAAMIDLERIPSRDALELATLEALKSNQRTINEDGQELSKFLKCFKLKMEKGHFSQKSGLFIKNGSKFEFGVRFALKWVYGCKKLQKRPFLVKSGFLWKSSPKFKFRAKSGLKWIYWCIFVEKCKKATFPPKSGLFEKSSAKFEFSTKSCFKWIYGWIFVKNLKTDTFW